MIDISDITPKWPDASRSNNYFVCNGDDLNGRTWYSPSFLTAEYERGKKEGEDSLKAKGWRPPRFPGPSPEVVLDRATANEMLKYLISMLGDRKRCVVSIWKALGHTDPPPV